MGLIELDISIILNYLVLPLILVIIKLRDDVIILKTESEAYKKTKETIFLKFEDIDDKLDEISKSLHYLIKIDENKQT